MPQDFNYSAPRDPIPTREGHLGLEVTLPEPGRKPRAAHFLFPAPGTSEVPGQCHLQGTGEWGGGE